MKRAIAFVAAGFLVFAPAIADSAQPTPPAPIPESAFHEFSAWAPTPRPAPPVYESDRALERTLAGPPPAVASKPKQIVVVAPKAPVPRHRLAGRASWYCRPGVSICAKGYPASGSYAAAGPALRAAICGVQSCTSWRGRTVYVDRIPVKLVDWCQCYWHERNEKIIDLYWSVFKQTGSSVTITWR